MNWQPIETLGINKIAEPEQPQVLLLDKEGNVRIGERVGQTMFKSTLDYGDFYAVAYYQDWNMPTHWMPLPSSLENAERTEIANTVANTSDPAPEKHLYTGQSG